MPLKDETGLMKGKVRTKDLARVKATEQQWNMASQAINAFAAKYPKIWAEFVSDTQKDRDFTNKYAEGKNERGKKMQSEFRKTAVFPTVNDLDGHINDSLLNVLEGIIPGLTHKDSVNYVEFLKRFPVFSPAWSLNV